jgi:heme A synthase
LSAGKYLVYATIASTFVLIVWGAYLTAGNWGGACGTGSSSAVSSDWPYCNGSLAIPNPYSPASYGAFVEYIHRTLSVLVGVILIATLVAVSRMKPRPSGAYRALLLSGVLLLIQIGLGNIVVNSDLNAAITALHLANATALFGVMVVSGVLIRADERRGGY